MIEEGSHDELLARGEEGKYFQLYHASDKDPARSRSPTKIMSVGVTDVLIPDQSGQLAVVSSETPAGTEEEKKADEPEKKVSASSRVWKLHEWKQGDACHFLVGAVGALLVGGANPAVGIIFVKCMWVLYYSDIDEMRNDSYMWSGIMLGVAVAQTLGDTARGWGFGLPGEKITVKLRRMFFEALLRQEIGWHDLPENASGTLCGNLASEINLVQALSGETLGRNVLTICTVITAFTFAFVFGNIFMTLVSLAMVPVMVAGMALELAMLSGDTGDGKGEGGGGEEAARIIGETVTSIRTVASFTLERRFVDSYDSSVNAHTNSATLAAIWKGFFVGFTQITTFSAFALLYWYGGKLVSDGDATFEEIFTPIFCMFMLGAGLAQVEHSGLNSLTSTVFSIVSHVLTLAQSILSNGSNLERNGIFPPAHDTSFGMRSSKRVSPPCTPQ